MRSQPHSIPATHINMMTDSDLRQIIKLTNCVIVCFAAFNSIDLPYGLSRDTLQSVAEYAGALLDEFSSKENDNDYGIYSQHLTIEPS